MMKIPFLVIMVVLTTSMHSQTIYETIISQSERYANIFSKETAKVNFELIRKTEVGSADTTFSFLVSISNETTEKEGYSSSVGVAFSGSGSAMGVSGGTQYSVNRFQDEYIMNLDTLNLFMDYVNELYVFSHKECKYSTVAARNLGKLRLAVEVNSDRHNNLRRFYLSLGDAVYSMNEEQFKRLIPSARNARDFWESAK